MKFQHAQGLEMCSAGFWWGLIVAFQAIATSVMVGWKIASLSQLNPGQEYGSPFFHAMATSDWLGAVVSATLLVAAPLVPSRCGIESRKIIDGIAARLPAVAAVFAVVLGAGTQFVHCNYPYSMDEYAAVFQAEVFAAGRTSGEWPPFAAPLMVSPLYASGQFFFCNYDTGRIISQYWPCHALLLSPFASLNAAWALNPLLAGAAILLIGSLARHFAGERAAGLAVLLAIASPTFYAYGISFYSMMSHLVANLLYARLLVQPTLGRSAIAGLIGGCALALHNPFPHTLFAASWIIWLCLSRRWWQAVIVIAGSLTVFSAIDGVWDDAKHSVSVSPAEAVTSGDGETSRDDVVTPGFSLDEFSKRAYGYVTSLYVPSLSGAAAGRTYSLVREIAWDAPGLVGLAVMGCAVIGRGAALALAGSALCTWLGYAFAPFDGGLGWGSRYMFSAWFALPVLAAAGVVAQGRGEPAWYRTVVVAAIGSVLLFVPIRLFEIRAVIDANLQQTPRALVRACEAAPDSVWVFLAGGDHARQDFIRNDPFCRHGPFILYGQGRHQDEKNIQLIATHLGRKPIHSASNRVGDAWVLKPPRPVQSGEDF